MRMLQIIRNLQFSRSPLSAAAFVLGLSWQLAHAEEIIEEQVVVGDLNSLHGENVDSVFGFDRSILETPRSASTVSEEMMDRFNMQDIDELILVSPGSFTQSFFGVVCTGRSRYSRRNPLQRSPKIDNLATIQRQ